MTASLARVLAVVVRVLLLCSLLLALVDAADEAFDRAEATKRLLIASLSCSEDPQDVDSIIHDARQVIDAALFPNDQELQDIRAQATGQQSCRNTQQQQQQTQQQEEEPDYSKLPEYADRHVQRVNNVVDDYDCMEREFDASDPDFDPREAAAVLSKCRLLVVRNVFAPEVIAQHKADVEEYINDIHFGRIDPMGETEIGENGYIVRRSDKRFDVLFPRYMLDEDIATNEHVMKILQDDQVFGEDNVANAIGTILAESGAQVGKYHFDDAYPYDLDSFENYGIAGADLPPYAITQFTPLQNTTPEHGPTEFCMGTNFLKGLRREPPVSDESLIAEGTPFYELAHFEEEKKFCPDRFKRVPLSNVGDVIFFDYTITHRGGANQSPDMRAMSYIFYSRPWFRDWNFDDYTLEHLKKEAESYPLLKRLTLTTKFAVVEETDYDDEEATYHQPIETIQNFMDPTGSATISNTNVNNAALYLGNGRVRDIAVGETITLKLPVGVTLRAMNGDGEQIGRWKIKPEEKQIVLRTNKVPSF